MRLPQPGDLFDSRYLIRGTLGEGGSGAVFDAEDTTDHCAVAIKVVKPDNGDGYDPRTRARFEREVRIAASLANQHTVAMLRSGESDGVLFIAFERVGGEDLSDLLSRVGRLSPDAVRHVLDQLLESLDEAHRAGLLHRDLKPENVRVFEHRGDPFRVKLLDFGIARQTETGGPAITKTGELVGTPRYMSPEQLTQKPLTAASDLYSVGLMAFEMLMGRDALQGGRWGDQLDRLGSDHRFAIPDSEELDTRLTAVIEKMCARNLDQRYATVSAVRAALDAIDSPPELPRAAETEGRKWVVPVAVAAVVLLIIGAMTWVESSRDPAGLPAAASRPNPFAAGPEPQTPIARPAAVSDVGTPADAAPAPPDNGCGREPRFIGTGTLGGDSTRWLTHVPRGYDPKRPAPLVILLHNATTDPDQLLLHGGFSALAEKEGFVVAAPAYGAATETTIWNDRDEVLAIVSDARHGTQRELCIDPSRIYVVGQGEGGRGASFLACEDWVAAIATNCFRLQEKETICDPPIPKPHIMLSPKHCGVHPFEGGWSCLRAYEWPSVRDVEERWLEHNACDKSAARETYDQRGSTCTRYDCAAPFESCHLEGGHPWPGTSRTITAFGVCDGDAPDFPSARYVWSFFSDIP